MVLVGVVVLVAMLIGMVVHYLRSGSSLREDWWMFALFALVAAAWVVLRTAFRGFS